MTEEPGWELFRSFLHVVRSHSLSAAARSLGLSQPTLGRHIAALESALGNPLFTRSPLGLRPTPAALELVPHAEAMAAAAAALRRTASGEAAAAHGTVRLTASEIMSAEVLPPMFASFRAAHPGIALELLVSNHMQDLLRRDADIAVRHLRPAQEALLARRIGSVRLGLYAHRRYVASHPLPASLAEAKHHTLLGFDQEAARWRDERVAHFGLQREDFAWRCDNDNASLAALRAGMGIGVHQAPLAAREPDLMPVLPDIVALPMEIWLAMHEDLRHSRRVRLLFDHLAEGLSRYLAPDGFPH
jgi:DNA-binding transcriptional LysR family regulator